MRLDERFDVNSLPASEQNFEVVPEGWYTALIHSAEIRATKDGNGKYIKMRYDITGPTHSGRVVFGNLNIRNPSAEAERIGRQQLGDIMRAAGLATLDDTDQLASVSLQIKVGIRPASGGYDAQNTVKGWKPVDSAAPAVRPASGPPAAAPSAGARVAPPWAAKK